LDLGFVRAIASLQEKKRQQTLDELIEEIKAAFADISRETLEKVFLSHQAVMSEIIKAEGTNEFKLPHLNKDKMKKQNNGQSASLAPHAYP